MPTSTEAAAPQELEISLVDIVKPLVKGRRFIAMFTFATVVVCLGLAYALSKYHSEGLYYFYSSLRPATEDIAQASSGMREETYDRIINSAKTLTRFEAYLTTHGIAESPEIELLRGYFESATGVGKQIFPLTLSLFDPNEPEKKKKDEEEKDDRVLGLKVTASARDADLAYRAAVVLTDYLVDTVVYEVYHNRLIANLNNATVQAAKIENELFQLQLKRPHLVRQIDELEGLIEKYAQLFGSNAQAQMRITTEDALGSSPVVKVMSLQLELAELDERVERLQRRHQQADLAQIFYEEALRVHQNVKIAAYFAEQQPLVLQTVFKEQNLNDEVIREIYNNFEIRNQDIRNLYQESVRLVVPPSLPATRTIKPGFALIGAGALLIGLFLAMMVVWCRAWWQRVGSE